MRSLSEAPSIISTENGSTFVHSGEHPFPYWLVATRALWPNKTAANLASRAHVTERAAKFWLAGDREPSPEAFHAVFGKIMERRRSS